jgi:succinate dehydrogenase/fumarate reductase flavoprotein subunit
MAQEQTYECDVLVIGSGAAGMAAAVTAASHGLKVLIAEKEPRFGGTARTNQGYRARDGSLNSNLDR